MISLTWRIRSSDIQILFRILQKVAFPRLWMESCTCPNAELVHEWSMPSLLSLVTPCLSPPHRCDKKDEQAGMSGTLPLGEDAFLPEHLLDGFHCVCKTGFFPFVKLFQARAQQGDSSKRAFGRMTVPLHAEHSLPESSSLPLGFVWWCR